MEIEAARPAAIAASIQKLIRRMAQENPTWGEERIAELLLKLHIRVSPRTVRRYMPVEFGPRKRIPSQRWVSRENVIAVTGATGRVGHLVAQRLLAAGHTVRVAGRSAEKLKPLAGQGAEVRTGSLFDPAFLTDAFRGTAAAFVLTALDVKATEVNTDQYKKAVSIATAIRDAGVQYVVFLSSWGTDLPGKSGGIIGCCRLEELLDEIPGLNVVRLRPVWFMGNFLWNIGLIKMAGINGLAIKPEVSFPMIATGDIAPLERIDIERFNRRANFLYESLHAHGEFSRQRSSQRPEPKNRLVHDYNWEYATDAARRYLAAFARMLSGQNVLNISRQLFDRRPRSATELL